MADDRTHADRYAELPEQTREFIEDLRPEEIQTLREAIRLVAAVGTVSRFLRWVVLGALAGLFLFVQFLDLLPRVKAWWGK